MLPGVPGEMARDSEGAGDDGDGAGVCGWGDRAVAAGTGAGGRSRVVVRVTARNLFFDLEGDIERRHGVGDGADGDAIDAGEGDGAGGFERDAAGGFERYFAAAAGFVA